MDEMKRQKYLNFIQKTLQTSRKEQFYSLLVQQEELLTLELGEVLSQWVDNKLSQFLSWQKKNYKCL